MWKYGRSIYEVFAKKNFWANDSQVRTPSPQWCKFTWGGEIEYMMNNIVLKNTECCTLFLSLVCFYPKGFFLVRFLRGTFFYQWTLQGECYELMIVHWFDTFAHMIDTHMIHFLFMFLHLFPFLFFFLRKLKKIVERWQKYRL